MITTFFRIIDIHNEKIFRVRYEEQSELDRLRARLGYCTFAKTGLANVRCYVAIP